MIRSLVQCRMLRSLLFLFPLTLLLALPAGADIPIKDGCTQGASQLAHGLSATAAEARIREYARLYVGSYSSYNRQKSDIRRKTNRYLELDEWTQSDIIGFTGQQRELLYISVAGELAVGRIDTSELPGYVVAIDRKIHDIEVELGCNISPPP